VRGDGAEELYGEGTPLLARLNSIGFVVEGTWSVSVVALLPVECNGAALNDDDDGKDDGDGGAFIDCEIAEYRCASDFGDALAALWLLLLLLGDGCLFAFSASVALWQKTRISVAA
jgi:hypothetical protein